MNAGVAMAAENFRTYFDQFVKTATKGNDIIEYAYVARRMCLHCKLCDQTLTVSEPEDSMSLDYSVQEFVKIHAHIGGHKDEPVKVSPGAIIPLTCDFKKTKSYPALPQSTGKGYGYYDGGMIDANSKNEAKIKQQLDAYNKEMTAKLNPLQLAQKAKEIKETDAAIKAAVKEILLQKMPESAITEEDMKAQEQALKNLLKLAEIAKQTQIARGVISGVHPEPKKKSKPLKIATGRRFR